MLVNPRSRRAAAAAGPPLLTRDEALLVGRPQAGAHRCAGCGRGRGGHAPGAGADAAARARGQPAPALCAPRVLREQREVRTRERLLDREAFGLLLHHEAQPRRDGRGLPADGEELGLLQGAAARARRAAAAALGGRLHAQGGAAHHRLRAQQLLPPLQALSVQSSRLPPLWRHTPPAISLAL
eukprot:scaffold104659_cov69-Phaeocystis_antarctica.AAC.8